jgi:hypothetical protein
MPDLIATSLTAKTLTAGGTTSLQLLGGSPGNQWIIADIEMPAADAQTLIGNLQNAAPKFFKGTQTVNLSAANNTAYTVAASAGLVAGMQISIATQANAGAPTVLSINSVDSGTALHVTFVSGANAANVTTGDIFIVTSQPAGTSTTLNYPANNLAQVFNAL